MYIIFLVEIIDPPLGTI